MLPMEGVPPRNMIGPGGGPALTATEPPPEPLRCEPLRTDVADMVCSVCGTKCVGAAKK
jgi:hypothetical protein